MEAGLELKEVNIGDLMFRAVQTGSLSAISLNQHSAKTGKGKV